MKDNNYAVEVKNVKKSFFLPKHKSDSLKHAITQIFKRKEKGGNTFNALNGISFTIEQGDFFGVVGRNGAGKSTLLKLLADIYQPAAGSIKIKGKLVPFIELGVGFNLNLSGRENVYLNGALLGFSKKEIDEKYDEIVHFAELEDFMEQKLKNYSSGMKVRLAFSVAIQADADILLLDEVLAVGDSAFQEKCYNYFEKLKRDKKTVILVTHSMANIERFCNRALLINRGEVAYIGSSDEAAERYNELFVKPNEAVAGTKEQQLSIVKDVSITVNKDSKKTTKIKAFKELSVGLNIIAKKLIQKPNISLTITDKKGNFLFSQDTISKNISIESIKPNQEAKLRFNIENVYTNGEYSIGVVIMATGDDGKRVRIYDMQDLHLFSIFGVENNAHSIVHPRVDVSIS